LGPKKRKRAESGTGKSGTSRSAAKKNFVGGGVKFQQKKESLFPADKRNGIRLRPGGKGERKKKKKLQGK